MKWLIENATVSFIEVKDTTVMSNDSWVDKNEDQNYVARHECSFVQAGDKFYMFGGRESPQRLDSYDYNSNTWSTRATVPMTFNHFQATEYEGLVWVIGAFKNDLFPLEKPAGSLYVYGPANNAWMQGPDIPVAGPAARRRRVGSL